MCSFRASSRVIRQYRLAAAEVKPPEAAPRSAPEDDAAPECGADMAAETLLAQAQLQVAEMIGAARAEVAGIHQRAYEEGRQAGRQAGHAEGQNQAQAAAREQITRLAQLVESLVAERARLLADAEEETVELALAIARKVVGDAAAGDPGVILQMVAQAVEVLGSPTSYEVHVNPEDAAATGGPPERVRGQQRVDARGRRTRGCRRLHGDPRGQPGGCAPRNTTGLDRAGLCQLTEVVMTANQELTKIDLRHYRAILPQIVTLRQQAR